MTHVQYSAYTSTNYSLRSSNCHSTSLNDSSSYEYSVSSNGLMMSADQSRESASSILQSVKEQEVQFEKLTRELEAERRSVADQLEQCKVGSQAGSVLSLNSATLDNGGYSPYIEQGADPSSLLNGEDADSSRLMDSCLRALQERGIMQSADMDAKGKSVAFGQDETHRYNGYDSHNASSLQSSQNSYRQPEGAGMSRSQASYSLNSAAATATDNYAPYSQFDPPADGQEQYYDDEYRDYREPYVNINTVNNPQLSDGDYVDSSAAASCLNNYDGYADQRDMNPANQQPRYMPGEDPGDDYMYQGPYIPEPQQDGDYIDQGPYTPQANEPLFSYRPTYNGSNHSSQASQEFQPANGDHPNGGEGRDTTGLRGSRDHLGQSQEQLAPDQDNFRASREQLEGRRTQPVSHDNLNYSEDRELYPSVAAESNRFSSFNGARNYEDSGPAELYGADNTEPVGACNNLPSYNDQRTSSHPMLADPALLYGSRQSLDSRPEADQKWRPPDLPEVIEYLGHSNDAIKANAAAYLQHLCFGNNEIKTKTRSLRGIPALVNLLYNDIPEVHRNALGALLNLSRGYENDDNKRAIKNCTGIEALAALLERSRDNDVRELITGIMWNMSSLGELKKSVITSSLSSLVRSVILPAAGISVSTRQYDAENSEISWSTEFRNATGVLRNVSSDGPFARKHLRECDGLMEALLKVTHSVIKRPEMDNKPVENVVCTLRNLSFRLMEVDYPDYYDKKANELQQSQKKPATGEMSILGCFSKSKPPVTTIIEYPCRTELGRGRGEQLWQLDLVDMYLPLLSDCSNTDTLEAAIGAVQNLTACEWQPSIQFREHIRKKRGLPTIVELLGLEEADNVVCGAAIALRNLALDKSNKTLIGKYAIEQLVSKLPSPRSVLNRSRASEETIRAVLATLHEVFKEKDTDSLQHASTLVNDSEGLERLMAIAKSQRKYISKTLRSVHQLLTTLWRFTSLREVYRSKGYKESDFLSKSMVPKSGGQGGTMSVNSTLTRPRSEPASNSNTIARSNMAYREDQSDERMGGPNDQYLGAYPSTGTLPIQRPLYEQQEGLHLEQSHNSYSYQRPPSYDTYAQQPATNQAQAAAVNGSYSYGSPALNGSFRQDMYPRQQSYEQEYPTRADIGYHNQPLDSSHNFSGSKDNLVGNSHEDYGGPQTSHGQAEPLYARVDKKKSNLSQGYPNPQYNNGTAISMESLNNRGDSYSFQPQTESTGVDSWV